MLKDKVTVLAQSTVRGPDGKKTQAGKFYKYDDSPYLRILVKSGSVTLVDPPSLDDEYLERAGYVLQEGYTYSEKKVPEEAPKDKTSKKKEPEEKDSNEVDSAEDTSNEEPTIEENVPNDHEPQNLQLTPPVGMGVKESEENKGN